MWWSTGSKKYRFFKPINKGAFYELDIEKIQEDQKYDGYYVYETNRTDLSLKEVITFIFKTMTNWSLMFKTLKGKLSLRPMYLSTWNHIVRSYLFMFTSLVFLNYIIYILNCKS
nr:hypothetical protein [Mycoplasmopsis bovis]